MQIAKALAVFACIPFVAANADPGTAEEGLKNTELDQPTEHFSLTSDTLDSCTDTIEQASREPQTNLFQRDVAPASIPQPIFALDYDIDGCDYIVTVNGVAPLPPSRDADAPLFQHASQ